MPSNVVHNYFAKTVFDKLDIAIKDLISVDFQAFLLGSQGPDILFYLRFEKEPVNVLGERMHDDFNQYEIFKRSGEFAVKENEKIISAYVMGNLCHYALDSTVHPYICYRENDLSKFYPADAKKRMHILFESNLDYICIKDFLKVNTTFYKCSKNINISKKSREKICDYISKIVAPSFGMELDKKSVEKSYKYMKFFLKFCDDAVGLRYMTVRGLEKLCKAPRELSTFFRPRKERKEENWLNHDRKPFPKYKHRKEMTTETFEEMAERAAGEAVKLINNYYEFILGKDDLNKEYYYKNYGGELNPEYAPV